MPTTIYIALAFLAGFMVLGWIARRLVALYREQKISWKTFRLMGGALCVIAVIMAVTLVVIAFLRD